MKQTIVVLVGLALAVNAFGQGQVTFNCSPTTAVRTEALGGDKVPGSDAAILGSAIAGLYYSTSLDPATANWALATTTTIRTGTFAGVYSAGAVTIEGVAEGGKVLLQVRAWTPAFGGSPLESYEAALATESGDVYAGFSNVLGDPGVGVTLGGPVTGIPIPATSSLGVQGFVLTPVPEPSTIALGLLGGLGVMVLLRRRK